MAAAPIGADKLNWEAEEVAILRATQRLGMELAVEESGELPLLAARAVQEKADVVQISCHGLANPPSLLLEDETGALSRATVDSLITHLRESKLLFLSACHSADSQLVLDSLARALVRAGQPAVLGWCAPVYDHEATLFASALYEQLCLGRTLEESLARARYALFTSETLRQQGKTSRDWHLARLYLSPGGGGHLATPNGPKRQLGHGRALKQFLDFEGKVPVAGEFEFVGRRRQIQTILREFRAPSHAAGVLIHGMGRHGKSSLAARIAHRLEQTHRAVVLFGRENELHRYSAPALLQALRERCTSPAVSDIVDRYLDRVRETPRALTDALQEILEGPCNQLDPAANHRPLLLVIDDLEKILEGRVGGFHTVHADYVETLRAVILAFANSNTESRLLFTSRFQFTLPGADGRELARLLLPVDLPEMNERESWKQASARFHLLQTGATNNRTKLPALERRSARITRAASGNPGLQSLLFNICLEDPAVCDQCLTEIEAYRAQNTAPQQEQVREFLANLYIGKLLLWLTSPEQALLRAATVFHMPVPEPVFRLLGLGLERLVALGLCEVFDSLYQIGDRAVAVNDIVLPLAGKLTDAEVEECGAKVAEPLLEAWGGEAGRKEWTYSQAEELTRLGLLGKNPRAVAASSADTLAALDKRFEYRAAAALGKSLVEFLDAQDVPPPINLLRRAAEASIRIGETSLGVPLLERAVAEINRLTSAGQAIDVEIHSATLRALANALVTRGAPDEALQMLNQVLTLSLSRRTRAIALGAIARIRKNRGEVDDALALHQEALNVYEELGHKHSRAVTQGDIALIRADKGEVDAALALHNEALKAYDELGDKRSRAITQAYIARMSTDKGEVDAAIAFLQEKSKVCEDLGDNRERAITLGDIARIRKAEGELDDALALHQEVLKVHEELGDKRSRAITLGDIADIRMAKGDEEAALALQTERLKVHRELGDLGGIAATLYKVAQLHLQGEQFVEAFQNLFESYQLNLQLGRLDGIAMVGLDLGALLCYRGQTGGGRVILERSRAGFLKLGRPDYAQQSEAILQQFL